ncbi:MAG: HlyD family efflux transporter periplasmic adaptor subunit [Burkholderiales bacterium]|nr:HlyD family efflux transporter periplasmic adaptor subunit [Burkholderiales bacterium]
MIQPQPDIDPLVGPSADEQVEEAALWAAFSSARSGEAAAGPWARLQARRMRSARACAVFRVTPDGMALIAAWPDSDTLPGDLSESASEGVQQGVALVRSAARGFHLVCPLSGDDGWVATVEVAPLSAPALQGTLDTLHWGVGWLEAARARGIALAATAQAERLELAARLAENVARESDARTASMALATGIGAAFGASAVSVGVLRRGVLSVKAEWQSPEVPGEPTPEAGDAAAVTAPAPVDITPALHSVLEVGRAMSVERHEPVADGEPERSPAPIELLAVHAHVCALPLPGPDGPAGAILVERTAGDPFSHDEVASLETIALQAAPLIEAKPLARPVTVTRERRAFVALFGPVRMKLKLALIALLTLALVMLGATGHYAVPVEGTVEGQAPRTLPAPFSGVLGEVLVRKGDAVRRGQLVARMDDSELLLERDRLTAERTQLARVTREAREIRDRGASESLDAKLKEVEARLRTVEERLARTRVVSPTDGVVVGGSGLNASASRVEAGEPLVEIAPVDSYRLVLWVDERDLALLREGQAGTIALPGETSALGFTVKRLTGVSTLRAGHNRVRIEALLQDVSERTRPGAEGSGVIEVGKRKQVWIWWRALQRDFESWR